MGLAEGPRTLAELLRRFEGRRRGSSLRLSRGAGSPSLRTATRARPGPARVEAASSGDPVGSRQPDLHPHPLRAPRRGEDPAHAAALRRGGAGATRRMVRHTLRRALAVARPVMRASRSARTPRSRDAAYDWLGRGFTPRYQGEGDLGDRIRLAFGAGVRAARQARRRHRQRLSASHERPSARRAAPACPRRHRPRPRPRRRLLPRRPARGIGEALGPRTLHRRSVGHGRRPRHNPRDRREERPDLRAARDPPRRRRARGPRRRRSRARCSEATRRADRLGHHPRARRRRMRRRRHRQRSCRRRARGDRGRRRLARCDTRGRRAPPAPACSNRLAVARTRWMRELPRPLAMCSLFLHADTVLPADAGALVCETLAREGVVAGAFSFAVARKRASRPAHLGCRPCATPAGRRALRRPGRLLRGADLARPRWIWGRTGHGGSRDGTATSAAREGRRAPGAGGHLCPRMGRDGLVWPTAVNVVGILAYSLGVDPDRIARWRRSIAPATAACKFLPPLALAEHEATD